MPKKEYPKLPQRKLREFLNTPIKVEKVIFGTSKFGDYVLLITATDSIISSGDVVMKTARELSSNLPATVTPQLVAGKDHEYFILA